MNAIDHILFHPEVGHLQYTASEKNDTIFCSIHKDVII